MAISKVNLCNISLSRLGHKKFITSLDPADTTVEGQLCDMYFEQTAAETLEMVDCRFARSRARCTRLTETPAFGYDYAYQLPGNCLIVRKMVDSEGNDTTSKWTREGNTIITDLDACYIEYTKYVVEPDHWNAMFRRLFVLRLAADLSTGITASDNRLDRIQNEMFEVIRLIKNNNAAESDQTGRKRGGNNAWDEAGTG